MSRVEVRGTGNYSMAFGVDHLPTIGAFVQVWDHTEWDTVGPENVVENHDRITTGGYNLSVEFVVALGRKYYINVDPSEVYKAFD